MGLEVKGKEGNFKKFILLILFPLFIILFVNAEIIPENNEEKYSLNPTSECAAIKGLINWWPGESTPADIVGGVNTQWIGTPSYTTGIVNSSFSFSASGLSAFQKFILHNEINATVEFWLNVGDTFADRAIFWTRPDDADVNRFNIHNVNGNLYIDYRDPGENIHFVGGPVPVNAGQWYHIAIVRIIDPAHKYLIYKDGQLVSYVIDQNPNLPNEASEWHMAYRTCCKFFGSMDEISFFDRALTTSEIQEIYNAGSQGKCRGFAIAHKVLDTARLDEFISYNFETVMGTPPYNWSSINGTIPNGMNLYSDGVLNGTPTEAGNFIFKLRVIDSLNQSAEKTFTLKVSLELPEPTLELFKAGTRTVVNRFVHYLIILNNIGISPATNITIIEEIDTEKFELIGSPNNSTIVDQEGISNISQLIWNFSLLEPGGVIIIHYFAWLKQSVPLGTTVVGGPVYAFADGIGNNDKNSLSVKDEGSPTSEFPKKPVPNPQLCPPPPSPKPPTDPGYNCNRKDKKGNDRLHKGADISATEGSSVSSVMDGVFDHCDTSGELGIMARVKHDIDGRTCFSEYGHLQSCSNTDKLNKKIPAGTEVGKSGTTGNAKGTHCPHVHFQWRCDGYKKPVSDPCIGLGNPKSPTGRPCSCDPLTDEDATPASGPVDPNEKVVSEESYIKSNQELTYAIYFENIGDAEALDVFLTDNLEATLNVSTLKVFSLNGSFINISDGQKVVLFQQNKTINETLGNFTINTTIIEEWTVKLQGNTLSWNLSGIFLPPNTTDNVLFSIKPLQGLTSGTEIRNNATIQFEIFEPITTNDTINIIDDIKPSCVMNNLSNLTTSENFIMSWNGLDNVGEIQSYIIFSSVNGSGFSEIISSTDTSFNFTSKAGNNYRFICIARDTAGNTETQEPIAETSTMVQLCGDVNADNKVNLQDIIYLVNYIFKGGPTPKLTKLIGDVNKDGNVNIGDLVYLVNYIFKGGPKPCA